MRFSVVHRVTDPERSASEEWIDPRGSSVTQCPKHLAAERVNHDRENFGISSLQRLVGDSS
jgi:hypothetical protein